MALESGTRLGHYEITDQIGKGGMGEVYRARDTKLGREVAIKVLPSEFSRDEERLARLEREARMLAALNHPNIAAIHGLEESYDTRFLVLELVDGDTLADRLQRGAIPIEESLELALQIAEALNAAHEKGVIHRDLKPANIKVTPEGRVKVLDFGLAKAFAGGTSGVDLSNSPTLSMQTSQAGIILGTAGYMAPEQARGESADGRADVWAFGCVLFEMLSGRKAYPGTSVADVLVGVLKHEPAWASLPETVHPRVRYLLERCLEKDRKDRSHAISEVSAELRRVLERPSTAPSTSRTDAPSNGRRTAFLWAASVVFAALVTGAVFWNQRPAATDPRPVRRFRFLLPEGDFFTNVRTSSVDVSPDGTRIVYSANQQLYLLETSRTLDAVPIRGTDENPAAPIFSSDGQKVAYMLPSEDFSIKTVPVSGGVSQLVWRGTGFPVGQMEWTPNDEILFAQPEGIVSVPADGGGQAALVVPAEANEILVNPQLLPNDKGILFVSAAESSPAGWDTAEIVVQSASGRKTVYEGGSDPTYLPTGHIVFAEGNNLFAFPFDVDSLERTGAREAVLDTVLRSATGLTDTAHYAVSEDGALVHVPPFGTASSIRRSLVWVDRAGRETPVIIPPDDYTSVRISPDATRLALVVGSPIPDAGGPPPDIYVFDLESGTLRQLTDHPEVDDSPVWSDNGQILFRSFRNSPPGVYSIPAGGGQAELVAASAEFPNTLPWSMSNDGDTLAVIHMFTLTDINVATLSVNGTGEFAKLLDGSVNESEPSISPNGEWMAYFEASGFEDPNIRILPFPNAVQEGGIRVGPGSSPVWAKRDGSELFYVNDGAIWALPVEFEPNLRLSTPVRLFGGDYLYGVAGRAWDPHPDGQRFLMIKMPDESVESHEEDRAAQINVILNWSQELLDRVPVP